MAKNISDITAEAINGFIGKASQPETRVALETHLAILEGAEGSPDAKVRTLSQHIHDEMYKIMASPSTSRSEVFAMAAHQVVGEFTAALLRGVWEERVRTQA